MIITVLGTGCKNCKRLLDNVNRAVHELPCAFEVIYQTDLMEIAKTGLMRTPGLMVDGKIVVSGSVPEAEEIQVILRKFIAK